MLLLFTFLVIYEILKHRFLEVLLSNEFMENGDKHGIRVVADAGLCLVLLSYDIQGQLVEGIAFESLDVHSVRKFLSCLLGITDEEDLARIDVHDLGEVFHLAHDGRGLATSRTAYHEAVVLLADDGSSLLVVQGVLQDMVKEILVSQKYGLLLLFVMFFDEIVHALIVFQK